MSVFQKYIKYYDAFYADKDYKKESDYIYSKIFHFNKKPATILNLGCGTGNHDFNLLKHHIQLTSVDASKESIKTARAKSKEKSITGRQIKFIHSDIRKLKLNKQFDCAIALFHVINYLNTNKDLTDCFQSVGRHLKKRGLFVFDSWYGPAVLHDLPQIRSKSAALEGRTIIRKSIPTLHPNENIVEIKFEFEVLNKRKTVSSFSETHKMRYLFYPDVEMLLKICNFRLIHTEEWMTGRPLGLNSRYALFIARKL